MVLWGLWSGMGVESSNGWGYCLHTPMPKSIDFFLDSSRPLKPSKIVWSKSMQMITQVARTAVTGHGGIPYSVRACRRNTIIVYSGLFFPVEHNTTQRFLDYLLTPHSNTYFLVDKEIAVPGEWIGFCWWRNFAVGEIPSGSVGTGALKKSIFICSGALQIISPSWHFPPHGNYVGETIHFFAGEIDCICRS